MAGSQIYYFSHAQAQFIYIETYRRVNNFTAGSHQSWNDQQSVVYDSFERYSGCRYFAIIDQDEFFIPGKYRTLGGMFVSIPYENLPMQC